MLRYLSIVALSLIVGACGQVNSHLEKMIPADATAVICIDVPEILKNADLLDADQVVLPTSLQQAIDQNDQSPMSLLLTDLPHLGIDVDNKVYVFCTIKTFGTVVLVPLHDAQQARNTLSQRVGGQWSDIDGLECLYVEDNLYAIKDKVLLVGHVNKAMEVKRAATAARNILEHRSTSIIDNKQVKACLHNHDTHINAWLLPNGLKALLNHSAAYQEIAQQLPLISVFTESDIEAMTCYIELERDEVELDANIQADANSEYVTLLSRTLSQPNSRVLKAIPNSMDYIVSMSVHGDQLVQLKQIQQLLSLFGKLPNIGRIDLASMLSAIDGPLALGIARDPHLEGEWNAVLAASTTTPKQVISQISTFANSMGQAPEIYDGEYIYQYDNKMIRVGQIGDDMLYIKVLDYEQTEGYAYDIPQAKQLFDEALMGVFAHSRNDSTNGYFGFALKSPLEGEGFFTTSAPSANATLELLRLLCGIEVDHDLNATDDDDDSLSSLMGGAIDELQPVN